MPGFRGTLSITLLYLALFVMLPLSGLLVSLYRFGWHGFSASMTSSRAVAAYALSLGAALVAALINAVLGFLVAWVLVRYRFIGRSVVDALVDLPFALPTAVAGLTLTALYARDGWFGAPLARIGLDIAFTRLGVVVALVFCSLPFVIRSVQPALEELDPGLEEAAAVLGASRWQTFSRVILPSVLPSLLTGFTLAFARALGEYGSIVFISGNLPWRTEIIPLLIVTKLEQYDYAGATALASVMLLTSFGLLLCINLLQRGRTGRSTQPAL